MKKHAVRALCVLAIVLCAGALLYRGPHREGVTVHFYDVAELDGQWGDCTFFTFPDGSNLLVDCGTAAAGEIIAADLRDRGVEKIDVLVLTHFHADHVGGYRKIAEMFPIGRICSPGYVSRQFAWVEEDIAARKIPYTYLRAGDTFTVGTAEIDVLWPLAELVAENPTLDASDTNCVIDTNNRSLVFRLKAEGVSVLMTADIYKQAQRDILDAYAGDLPALEADILKIPHHGYENAVNIDFIQAVSPRYAVMEGNHVMTNVSYRHYTEAGCATYASWMNGNVFAMLKDGEVTVTADSLEINDYYK